MKKKVYEILMGVSFLFALIGGNLDLPHMYKIGIANMIYSAYVLLKDEKI